MTDGTTTPDRPKTKRSFWIPEAVLTDVHAWAEERGLSDNGATCWLLRSALILVINHPEVMPAQLTIAGPKRRRSYVIPDHILAVLSAWADQHDISDNVALTVLLHTVRAWDDQIVSEGLPTLPLPRKADMTTTTVYGSWVQYVPGGGYDPADYIRRALGADAEHFNLATLETAFREQLADRLPQDVILAGDQFIGPAYPADPVKALEGPGFTEQVRDAIDRINFWHLAQQHLIETEA